MMRTTANSIRLTAATLVLLAGSLSASAQVDLFSNRSASVSTPALGSSGTSASGVTAPVGFTWSEVANVGSTESNAIAGFSTHTTGLTGAYRFADDFTITEPSGWTIDRVAFFAYQTNASPLASPFSAINVRIWSGRPGDVSSTIVYGNTTTNRLVSSTSTNAYRIFTSVVPPQPVTPDTTRLIWRTEATLSNLHLAPGTYWIDWQYTTTNPNEEAYSPAATTAGSRTQTGANARQLKVTGGMTPGAWVDAIDPGKPSTAADVAQDFPFILIGNVGTSCPADFSGDGLVNSQDFFDFLAAFFAVSPEADVNHDNLVNSQDFFDFLGVFFVGC